MPDACSADAHRLVCRCPSLDPWVPTWRARKITWWSLTERLMWFYSLSSLSIFSLIHSLYWHSLHTGRVGARRFWNCYLCRSLQFVSIYKFKAVMNQGRYVFMQLVDFLPRKNFEWLVKKYEGNKYIKRFKGEKEKRPQGLSLRVFIIFCPYR